MKNQPVQLLRGNTLRTEIYNSISRTKLANTTRLLRHTLTTQLRCGEFQSEGGVEMKTEVCSPAPKTEHSMHKMSKSVNQSWVGRKTPHKEGSKSKDHLVDKNNRKKIKTDKPKSKSQILLKRKPTSTDQSNFGSQKKLNISYSSEKHKSKDKPKSSEKHRNKAMSSSCRKINLESIIEQSSSDEKLVTPNHKNTSRKKDGLLSQSRTKKKDKNTGIMSEQMKKKIEKSFKEPEVFQKLLKLTQLTVSYRILKKRLIEIQIYTLKPINRLKVTLEKGNLECQSVREEYSHISANIPLSLFCAVRNIDLEEMGEFPKIELDIDISQEDQIQRSVILPYTWLHMAEEKTPSLKKSKIKTKLCLSDIPISSTHIHVLSDIFHTWLKKTFKGQVQFQTSFILCEQDYSLKLLEEGGERFSLELEGRGEARLRKMIQFLQGLIC